MICEICKKDMNKMSQTPEEAMKKYIAMIKKDNKKFKEKNDIFTKSRRNKFI